MPYGLCMFYSTENLCFDVVCMFYARGPVRMDVSNGESRGARDSSEQTRNASQSQ